MKRMLQTREKKGPGLRSPLRYSGAPITVAGVELHPAQKKECDEANEKTPLSIRATMDLRVHLTLNAQINLLPAITLMDLRATRVFMHPTSARACHAKIRSKAVPREVQVIDGRAINSRLIA